MKKESINNKDYRNLKANSKDIIIWFNEKNDITSTLKFIEVLKQCISLILLNIISSNTKFLYKSKFIPKIRSEDLSLLIGQKKYHIKIIIKKATNNPHYTIDLKYLQNYEENLRKNLAIYNVPNFIINNFIEKIIYKYWYYHNPPFSNRYRSKKIHPKLIENYFKNIDTVEKAYWLGLLWVDGWISETFNIVKKYPNYEIGLKQCKKNYTLVRDYCLVIGFNQKYLHKHRENKLNTVSYLARFMNSRFAQHLINLGFIVGNEKSLNIEMPNLMGNNLISQKELYLGFILGYYDGDGTTGRTKITSGSYNFILQIKEYFNIKNKISVESFKKQDNTLGIIYRLELGRDLMALMFYTYDKSFKLKRLAIGMKLIIPFNKLVRCQEILLEKGKITENHFQEFIWKLGHRLEFSYDLISDKCKEFYVELPTKKEWESRAS